MPMPAEGECCRPEMLVNEAQGTKGLSTEAWHPQRLSPWFSAEETEKFRDLL